MNRNDAIDYMVSKGYTRTDAEQLPTDMLLDMVAYDKSLQGEDNDLN